LNKVQRYNLIFSITLQEATQGNEGTATKLLLAY
jgi:hypothetical protein